MRENDPVAAANPPSDEGAHRPVDGRPPPPEPPPTELVPRAAPPPPPLPLGRRVPLRVGIAAAAAAVAVVSLAVTLASQPGLPKRARTLGARLDLAAGEVTVEDTGGKGSALSGTPLGTGARVKTARGARALVRTGEGASIFLRGETALELRERDVDVASGEVWLEAPRVEGDALACTVGPYKVSASDAGLDIRRDGDDIVVYVARGLAVLTSPGGRVEIGAGEQAVAKAGGKPAVAAVAFWQDWTGGMGDQHAARGVATGTGRIYGIDPSAPAGAAAHELGIAKQVVKAVVREGIAETEVDQTFSNPSSAPIEGWYWFSIPDAATVTSFALETNGQLVEGEVIEKREAAAQYANAAAAGHEPALLEWVNGRTYRARIHPVPASGTRRVVLRYMEMLPMVEGKTRYVYPLRSDDPVRYDELALSVDVGADEDEVELATSLDARVETKGRQVSMRRSGYVPRADFQLEITDKRRRPPVTAWRFQAGADQADYVMLRYAPDKDFTKAAPESADVVLVVDTSAGGDEAARQLRTLAAEGALRALSDRDHFALVTLDVSPQVVYPKDGLAPATETDIARALEKLADHVAGGATDLGAMFEPALARLHGKEQAAVVYVGDGAATSGETASEALAERLRRSLTGSRARFFAIGTGSDARHEVLAQLARTGGGQYARVDEAGQTTAQALRLVSSLKNPVISDLAIDLGAGLDQPMYSATGKLSRGEELVLLARSHHPLPDAVTVHGRMNGKDFETKYPVKVDTSSVTSTLVPRLWAAEYVRRLLGQGASPEESRAQILQLGVEYGLVTPFTSSIALDSELAYGQQGIGRRASRLRGVRLTSIERPADEEHLVRGFAIGPGAVVTGCSKRSASAEGAPSAAQAAPHRPKAAEGQSVAAPAATPEAVTAGAVAMPSPVASAAPTAFADAPRSPPQVRAEPKDAARRGAISGRREAHAKSAATPPQLAAAAPFALPPVRRTLAGCSDAAARPLSERLVLWQKRAKRSASPEELATVYDGAFAACELPDWRDEAALLDVVQQRIDSEHGAEIVLAHFASFPEGQRYLAKNLLRRTVDPRVAAAVSRVLHGGVDWAAVDRELLDIDKPEKALARLEAARLVAPNDPAGDVRLVKLLARAGKKSEALAHGRRMRDRGALTPSLAQELGDVLADSGAEEEAIRTYSEIVEFDPRSAVSRRVLGDVFLRQGWHGAAYRQYKTLTDLDARDPLAWLRLANAAAGAGRVDEALRIERDVASGEGTPGRGVGGAGPPGADDPRMFAKLLSASRLGLLLSKPDPAAGITTEAVSRKLKELALFSGPGALVLLSWADLDAHLVLTQADDRSRERLGEITDAGAVGAFGVLAAEGTWEQAAHAVRSKAGPASRRVPFDLVTITWNGRAFAVTTKKGELRPGQKQEVL